MEEDRLLSPADESILMYLRNQVDRLQEERHRQDVESGYKYAVEDLKTFTRNLRLKGKNI